MKFIVHPQHTRSLGAPIGWDHSKVHCGSLSIQDKVCGGYKVMASRWQLEGYEDVYMMAGCTAELAIYGRDHPPVSMVVIPGVITAGQVEAAIRKLRQFAQMNQLVIEE